MLIPPKSEYDNVVLRQNRLAFFAAILAGAIWGVSFLAPRALEGSHSSTISLFRFLFYGFFSAGTLLIRRKNLPALGRTDFYWGIALSLLGYSFYYFLLSVGIQKSGTAFSTLIIGLLPLTILLSSVPRFRPRPLALPFLLILAGVLLIRLELFRGGTEFSGLVAATGALGCWTLFSVLNSRFLKSRRDWRPIEWSSWLGVFASITAFIIFFGVQGEDFAHSLNGALSIRFLLWTGFMGVVGAWITSGLWNYASRILPAAVVGQLLVAETIFGLIYGFIYEARWPTLYEGSAIILLLSGAILGVRAVNRIVGTVDRPVN